jgi:hypothetical protein
MRVLWPVSPIASLLDQLSPCDLSCREWIGRENRCVCGVTAEQNSRSGSECSTSHKSTTPHHDDRQREADHKATRAHHKRRTEWTHRVASIVRTLEASTEAAVRSSGTTAINDSGQTTGGYWITVEATFELIASV